MYHYISLTVYKCTLINMEQFHYIKLLTMASVYLNTAPVQIVKCFLSVSFIQGRIWWVFIKFFASIKAIYSQIYSYSQVKTNKHQKKFVADILINTFPCLKVFPDLFHGVHVQLALASLML